MTAKNDTAPQKNRSALGEKSFRTRQRKRRLVHAGAQTNAARVLGPLEPGIEIYTMVVGQFHAINVVEAIIDQIAEPVNLDISSWTIAHFEIERVAHYIANGAAARVRFITDRSFKTRHPSILATLAETVGRENIRVLRCHAKFATIQNEQWHIVIRTSANFNSNPRIENYEISDDPQLYIYVTEIVDEIFSIEKPIGRREMNSLKTIGERPPPAPIAPETGNEGPPIPPPTESESEFEIEIDFEPLVIEAEPFKIDF